MQQYILDNLFSIIGLLIGAFGVYALFIRSFDKLKAISDKLDRIDREGTSFAKENMQKVNFEITNQNAKVSRLEQISDKLSETLADLKSDVRLIAAWVKSQEGNTLIEERKRHE